MKRREIIGLVFESSVGQGNRVMCNTDEMNQNISEKLGKPFMFSMILFAIVVSCSCYDLPSYNGTFVPIKSLSDEDAHGLGGLSYNDTQPPVLHPEMLRGKRIAFIIAPCYEEVELTFPYIYFTNRAAEVDILGPWWVADGQVASCEYARAKTWTRRDKAFRDVSASDYDALVVPGGVWSSTVVRNDPGALKLLETGLGDPSVLVASVCSGTTTMINAGYFSGSKKTCTGSPSIRVDLVNAGCDYLDQPAVVHASSGVIFGRSPQGMDNVVFTKAIAEYLSQK